MSCVVVLERLKGPETNNELHERMSKPSNHLDCTAKRYNNNCKVSKRFSVFQGSLGNQEVSPPSTENVFSNSENSCSSSVRSFDFNEEDANADASATDEEIEMKCEQEHSFDIIMEDNVKFVPSDEKPAQVAN